MSFLKACTASSSVLRSAGAPSSVRRVCRIATRAAEPKQGEASTITPPPSTEKPTVVREFTSHGARIIESDARLVGPEDQPDLFEGENMETLGKVMERFFLPGLIVLGLICGSIAARSYNEEADACWACRGAGLKRDGVLGCCGAGCWEGCFIAPPTGPDADIVIIPAGALQSAPTQAAAPSVN
ncbi:hypothetical protein HXX76_009366 [Chlamydomonas incerta]|uniref:Uncharacterized protein n=1 Tax=Chlamydomonas incerta TaxID=51695 RepID=A0A835SRK7_CHLIN|nr:hypothetical protein HXX76_009366 [Chlamydomonas incerta]|eukprot:KAG2431873.1 hypothetical protein HXX76_009366 [Chlamydomonas incerta]